MRVYVCARMPTRIVVQGRRSSTHTEIDTGTRAVFLQQSMGPLNP